MLTESKMALTAKANSVNTAHERKGRLSATSHSWPNRPFTNKAAILNYLDFRSIMGCPGGMSTIRYTRSVYTRAFRTNSLSFPRKKIVVPYLDVIMIAFFLRNIPNV